MISSTCTPNVREIWDLGFSPECHAARLSHRLQFYRRMHDSTLAAKSLFRFIFSVFSALENTASLHTFMAGRIGLASGHVGVGLALGT